jgi:hydroxylamine reductase (hybrid-cluster protein)
LEHELGKKKVSTETIKEYAAMGGCTEPTIEGHSYGIVQAVKKNNLKKN